MRKRIFSILLTLCMVLSLMPTVAFAADSYSIWVGGVQVSSDNANDVLGDGTVSYDATTSTLTLNNASICAAHTGSTYAAAIYTDSTLKIALNGDNTVVGPNAENSCGIYCNGIVELNGSGSLNVMGGKATNSSYGIYSYTRVIVQDSSTVIATGGEAANSYGVYSFSLVYIPDAATATVTATGGKATNNSYGVCSQNGSISFRGGMVTATGGEAENSYGVYSYNHISIYDSSTVTATGGKATYNSYGVCSQNDEVSLTGSIVTATGGEAAYSCGVYGNSSITIDNATVTATGGKATYNSYGILSFSDKVSINENATVIATSGKAVYNSYGLSSCDDFSISGTSTLTATGGEAAYSCGVYVDVDGYFYADGNATVTATGGEATNISYGVFCIYSVNLSGSSTLTATAGKSTTYSYGVSTPNSSIDISDTALLIAKSGAAPYSEDAYAFLGVNCGSGSELLAGTYGADFAVWGVSGNYTVLTDELSALAGGSPVGTEISDGTASGYYWDGMDTLTLKNVIINAPDVYGIKLPDSGATIVLEGMNTVFADNSDSSNSYGIYGESSIDISGDGTLTVLGGTATNSSSYGIYGESSVDISGTVTAIGGTATNSYGIYSSSVTINDTGSVTAIGGSATTISYGIYGTNFDGSVTAIGGSAPHSYGICSNSSIAISVSVTAIGGSATNFSYGIYSNSSIPISAGSVTAIGGSAIDRSYGIYGVGSVTISGTATAIGGTSTISYGIYGDSITTSGTVTGIGGTGTSTSCGIYSDDINIDINGTATAISGTATRSYGIYDSESIVIFGTVTAIGGTATSSSCGIYSDDIDVSGTATAIGGSAANDSYGISGTDIDVSGTATAIGGSATNSYGICDSNSIAISASTTIASGNTQAMYLVPVLTGYTAPHVILASTNADGSNAAEWDSSTELTTYKYLKIAPKYLLSVNLNGGNGNTISDYYLAGTVIPIDAGTKSGSKFRGWTEAANLGNFADATVQSTTYTMPASQATITANWKSKNSSDDYYLTFETNGGSAMSQLFVALGTTIDLSKYIPTRNAYDFAGWYSDTTLTEKITSVSLTGNTTVYAKWAKQAEQAGTKEQAEPEQQTEPEKQETNPFIDVPNNKYYHDAVLWAVNEGIASGTSDNTFSPDKACTRAQAITFLWRTMGSPEPASTACPFTDVNQDEDFYKAVLWALEAGITRGTANNTFSPEATITRGQTMTFLWHAADSPATSSENPFMDIALGDYDYDAVLWALEKDITSGTADNTYSPNHFCTRGQLLTFLFRYVNK